MCIRDSLKIAGHADNAYDATKVFVARRKDVGSTAETTTITITTDVRNVFESTATNNKYILVYSAAGDKYLIWFDAATDDAVKPTGLGEDFNQEVSLTGDATAATTAGAIRTAVSGNSDFAAAFTIGGSGAVITLLDKTTGSAVDAVRGSGLTNSEVTVASSDGQVNIPGNLDVGSGIDVTGDSNVDGKLTITQSNSTTPEIEFDGNGPNFIRFNDDAGGTNGMDLVFRSSPNTIGFETSDNNSPRFTVNYSGQASFSGNLDIGAGCDVTGNITCTGTVDGRDVASDGSKLDGIESGATADQTAAEIRTLVESASDSNVFTDADHSKLNGIESGATADQSGSEIASALQGQNIANSTNGINNIYNDGWFRSNISGNGLYNQATGQHFYSDHDDYWNIAGGSSANAVRFRDEHAGTIRGYVYANNSNQIGFLNSSANWSLKCDNSGNVTATGNVTAYSDARLKTNVNTINDALGIVGKLRGVSFDWKESGKRSIGVIAQEVEKVLPELVLTQQVLDPTGESEIKSVDYGKIVGVLINAINELKEEVEELKNAKITG